MRVVYVSIALLSFFLFAFSLDARNEQTENLLKIEDEFHVENSENLEPKAEPNAVIWLRYLKKGLDPKIKSSKDFEPKPNAFSWNQYLKDDFDERKTEPFKIFEPKPNAFAWNQYLKDDFQLKIEPSKKRSLKQFVRDSDNNDKKNFDSKKNADKSVLRLHSMDATNNLHVHSHDNNSPLPNFFKKSELQEGNRVPLNLRPSNFSISRNPLFSREKAESIPFSSKILPYLYKLFSIPPDSLHAKSMKESLEQCEATPLPGLTRVCPTSVEAMFEFVRTTLGLDSNNFRAISGTHLTPSKSIMQNYTIVQEPKEIFAPKKFVSCHLLPYPYAVFYCHKDANTKAFKTLIVGDNGDRIDAVYVCHFDTASWRPDSKPLVETGNKPGDPVCHFAGPDQIIWVP